MCYRDRTLKELMTPTAVGRWIHDIAQLQPDEFILDVRAHILR